MALFDDLLHRFDSLSTLPHRVILTTILKEQKIPFTEESCGGNCTNVVVSMTKETKYDLLVANYDLDSYKLNEDGEVMGLVLLIRLIKLFQGENNFRPFKVLFSDRKNTGLIGSRHYAQKHRRTINRAIVLDMVRPHSQIRMHSPTPQAFKEMNYPIGYGKSAPKQDNWSFENEGLVNLIINVGMGKEEPETKIGIRLLRKLEYFLMKPEQPKNERLQPPLERKPRLLVSARKQITLKRKEHNHG